MTTRACIQTHYRVRAGIHRRHNVIRRDEKTHSKSIHMQTTSKFPVIPCIHANSDIN